VDRCGPSESGPQKTLAARDALPPSAAPRTSPHFRQHFLAQLQDIRLRRRPRWLGDKIKGPASSAFTVISAPRRVNALTINTFNAAVPLQRRSAT